jgi:hypothetical protein
VAAASEKAEAQAQAAEAQAAKRCLEAANEKLEAQLSEARERARAGEPALEAVQRQLEARGAEARRALDAAADAERAKAQLEIEAAGLREAVADLRRELDAGEGGLRRGVCALSRCPMRRVRYGLLVRRCAQSSGAPSVDLPHPETALGSRGRLPLPAPQPAGARSQRRTRRAAPTASCRAFAATCSAPTRRWTRRAQRSTSCGSGCGRPRCGALPGPAAARGREAWGAGAGHGAPVSARRRGAGRDRPAGAFRPAALPQTAGRRDAAARGGGSGGGAAVAAAAGEPLAAQPPPLPGWPHAAHCPILPMHAACACAFPPRAS